MQHKCHTTESRRGRDGHRIRRKCPYPHPLSFLLSAIGHRVCHKNVTIEPVCEHVRFVRVSGLDVEALEKKYAVKQIALQGGIRVREAGAELEIVNSSNCATPRVSESGKEDF